MRKIIKDIMQENFSKLKDTDFQTERPSKVLKIIRYFNLNGDHMGVYICKFI